ncbi:MAG: CoA transferase [Actinomycetota bacterium]|nr:CoA transferase [Actinomycetota bacterium]
MEHSGSDHSWLAELRAALDRPPPASDPDRALERWAASGAMLLTGPVDGPPRIVPPGVVTGTDLLAGCLADLGGPMLDGPALMGERAAAAGLWRRGATSVGGDAHLVEAIDGTVCLNLARPEDLDALPALVGVDLDPTDWPAVQRILAARSRADLVEAADLLGVPLGVPGTAPARPVSVQDGGPTGVSGDVPLVVEFGSLWAAPLCGGLLRMAGCRVIKVESIRRPDGARQGPAAFFDLLNAGKEFLAVDPTDPEELRMLQRLVDGCDVLLEASRPRALRQWGLDAEEAVERGTVWISITGYGRTGPRSNGVAFGDDAAVSGGLYLGDPSGFVADAVADPATGLLAAVLGLAALADGRGALVDLSLSGTARWLASTPGRMAEPGADLAVAPPRLRAPGSDFQGF